MHLEGLSVSGSDVLKKALENIHHHSRRDALDRAGLKRVAIKRSAREDERREELERSFGQAFRGVTSLPGEITEEIRRRIIDNLGAGQAGTNDVLRSILRDQIEGLDLDDPAELRRAIQRIWDRTRADLQRVIRSESINAYSRVQLQEWYDQGIRRVRRRSIDDDKTCATCRELSRPGTNEYDIEALLDLDYPVTQDPETGDWMTHPNCRCWFEPIVEDVWEDLENTEAELFSNFSRGNASASNVPIDDRPAVEKTLKEHKDLDMDVVFVPKIVDLPQWETTRLEELTDEVGADRAAVQISDEKYFNAVTEWYDDKTGIQYISGQAADIEHISAPVARAAGIKRWEELGAGQEFVQSRWQQKKDLTEKTIEKDGIQVFGGEPFYNQAASSSPKDYFVEAYGGYVTNPYVLITVDPEMYAWMNENVFGGREFLRRGGIK